uniref:Uncharacterized protein n=1 Tax=Amphilophus citrinellus TaxID=61819 RepID=A0A3Q0R8T4_AMPCI
MSACGILKKEINKNLCHISIDTCLSPGAPRTAVYKFVKCSPDGDQANCVTQQSPEMEWSPDLPSKLPASAAQDLFVFSFSSVPCNLISLCLSFFSEDMSGPWSLFSRRSVRDEAKPAQNELKEDHLLQL